MHSRMQVYIYIYIHHWIHWCSSKTIDVANLCYHGLWRRMGSKAYLLWLRLLDAPINDMMHTEDGTLNLKPPTSLTSLTSISWPYPSEIHWVFHSFPWDQIPSSFLGSTARLPGRPRGFSGRGSLRCLGPEGSSGSIARGLTWSCVCVCI